MNRPAHAIAFGGLVLLLAACGGTDEPTAAPPADTPAQEAPPPATPPPTARNALVIVVDTLRTDHLGCYGYERDTTPSIDALSAESLRFDRAYSTAPWTKPAVASMISGLYPSAHSVKELNQNLPQSVRTLAEILVERDYRTAGVVSHTLLSNKDGNGFGQGYEIYLESEAKGHQYVSTNGVTGQAIGVLEELARDERPFFLFVHYFDPHYNYMRHPEFGFAAARAGRLDGTQMFHEIVAMREDLDAEETRFLVDLYDEEIRFTDAGIGRLLGKLRELGLDESTLVVFTADHGEEFLERGWLGHTRTLYDELIRVPLVVRHPGGGSPRIERTPVSQVALAPTILELIGVDPSGLGFQAPSFAGLVRGEETAGGVVFSEVDFVPVNPKNAIKRAHKKAAIVARFKIVRDDPSGSVEIYDIESDPLETRNLADARPELRDRLRRVLEEQVTLAGTPAVEPSTRELSEEELEKLRALGYVQ